MSTSNPEDDDLVSVFERLTTTYSLCPDRLWSTCGEKLPELVPISPSLPPLDPSDPNSNDHSQCTFSFCEYSQRDFTAVAQRHECRDETACSRLQGLFPRHLLLDAIDKIDKGQEASTVWDLCGRALLPKGRPYLAVSHVWSDGTGAGAWQAGEVNRCLFNFFKRIAVQFGCEGIWWDTLSIPSEKVARSKAIKGISANFQNARVTLVHDLFLRKCKWTSAHAACFAIVLSPWFSRGWTALELSESKKVKVIFAGGVIKDLDREILFTSKPSESSSDRAKHKTLSEKIETLRVRRTWTLDWLLQTLGARYTSRPKDMAFVAGLLVGVDTTSGGGTKDVWQQDIYKNILKRLVIIDAKHLFHNSATLEKGFSWCPINIFDIPFDSVATTGSLRLTPEGDLVGHWRVIKLPKDVDKHCIWHDIHPLIRASLQNALRRPSECLLLTEQGRAAKTDRALLVRGMYKVLTSTQGDRTRVLCFRRIGVLRFHSQWEEVVEQPNMKLLILGRPDGTEQLSQSHEVAWDTVTKASSDNPLGFDYRVIGQESSYENETVPTRMVNMVLDDEVLRANKALQLAAREGNLEQVRECIERDYADHKYRDESGWSALHHAAWGGSVEVVNWLLDFFKAEPLPLVSAEDKNGNLPLHIAAENGFDLVVAKLLKDNGDIVHAEGINGLTALHLAAIYGHEDVVQLLLDQGAKIEAVDKVIGWTPLHCAAENGNEIIVAQLLQYGANIYARDDTVGWTPLHFAAMRGHYEVVSLLGKNGARNDDEDRNHWIPSQLAAANKWQKVVALLCGGDIPRRDQRPLWSVLHCRAMADYDTVTKDLAIPGGEAKLKAPDWTLDGDASALKWAAEHGQYHLVDTLLAHFHPDINSRNYSGQTSLSFAAAEGHDTTVKLLLSKGAYIPPGVIFDASRCGFVAVVRLLLEHGADATSSPQGQKRQHGDWTPLHYAASGGHLAVVDLLLDKVPDLNINEPVRWEYGYDTPLSLAVKGGHEALAELLKRRGARESVGDHMGFYSQQVSNPIWTDLVVTEQFGMDGGVDLNAMMD
ncbi:hypothetical protein OQA88_12443 [Cercophora sp. LCS_1]